MAEGIASSLVTGVLGKLGSALWDKIGLVRSFKDDVKDLERKLLMIQAVLRNAEEKSNVVEENDALRMWLSELKGAAYDVDDLLEEIQTQAVLRQQRHEVQNQNQLAKMVREFLSHFMHLKFKLEMAHRIKELREKINNIAKQRDDFGLAEAGPGPQAEFNPRETYSAFNDKKIVGRDDDKEKIVKLLLETNSGHDVSVIPIVGLGGLGKTTLAQLAFADGRVTGQQHFDLRVWVCVSTDFHMKTFARSVKSATETKEECDLDTLESASSFLLRIFRQKRFLLVLDDVWNEDQGKWNDLKVLFKVGRKGSKILVTTRSEKVAEIIGTVEPHRVKGLSDDDCWTLFKRLAFKEGEENDYPRLVEIGKQIVKKCGSLPLTANALGSMMRFKNRTEGMWLAIRDNEIWRLENSEIWRSEERTILPSLKLSYIQMPSALKQCFAYCSIFPKDYEIDKDDLIRQWIALGFISSHETRISMEDIGNEYFNDLLWISFFQQVWEIDRNVTCRMHDLVHDLAQSVAKEEVAVIDGEESTRIPDGCRYASIDSRFMPQIPTTVMRRLRALQFRESGSLIMTFYSEAKCLRLLDLHDSKISMLSSSIGKLKLLRYLNLSSTNIQKLPESITSLCNLQTLNLSRCREIRILPKFLGRLTNLRVLNLSHCSSLLSLPSSLCELKNLHDLNLSYLKSLVALPECIGSLQNLPILDLSNCSSLESLPSSSSDLQHLEKLDISGCGKLCELPKMIQKFTKLKELLNYDCSELKGMPQGIGKLVSLQKFPIFVIGKQDRVEHCASISELEHLKLVGGLEIKGLENVRSPVDAKAANLIEKNLRNLKLVWNVSSAEEGTDSTVLPAEEIETVLENLQPHQKLEKLEIEGYGGGKFPSWMMNRIGSCLPNLVKIKLANMPGCSSLPQLGQLPFLKELIIGNMPAVTNLGVDKFPALTRLELASIRELREWVTVLMVDDEEGRPEGVPIFPCLTHLSLKECPQLRAEPCVPPSVKDLTISRTSSENLSLILQCATPLDGGDAADSLQPPPNKGLRNLTIDECQQLTCLPESLRGLTSLHSLRIRDCKDLERIEDWLGELSNLQCLWIQGCGSLRYLPAHKMTALQELDIKECPLLLDADGQFVDTSVNHIEEVEVNGSSYPYKELASSSAEEERPLKRRRV